MSGIVGALEVAQYKACFLGCESLGDLPLNPTLFPFRLKFHCFSAELIWQLAAVAESCEAALPVAGHIWACLWSQPWCFPHHRGPAWAW